MRTKSAVGAVLGLVWILAGTAEANTFACCLPDATCEDLLLMQCEDRGGVSLVSSLCMDNPCTPVMAPLISVPAIVLLTIVLLTVAIFALMRRKSRA